MYFLDSLQVSFLSYGQTLVWLVSIYHKRTSSRSEISYVVFFIEEDPCINGAFSKGALFEKTLETLQKKTVNNSSVNVTLACSILDLLTNQARKAEGESLKKVSEARASSKN